METVLASPSFPLKMGEGGRSLTLVPSPEENEVKKIELKILHKKDKMMQGCAA